MGLIISLGICKMEIDWGKNNTLVLNFCLNNTD